jgi:anti-sigma factor RsiW
MSAAEKLTRCADIAPLLVFHVCDEVNAEECAQIETHLATCSACAARLAEERALREALACTPQPADNLDSAGFLLSQCRSELAEALDDLSAPPVHAHWRPFGWLRRWMALRPAWSGALLVLFGLALGTQAPQWFQAGNVGNSTGQALNVLAAPRLTDEQLSKMAVAGISMTPAPDAAPGTVQVQLRAEQPLVLSGNVDDADVRRVLTYVVENGERFDPGVRLDCLDALKARTADLEVRRALISAVRKDQNPAVRMKALESLRESAPDEAVREVLLDALQHDANPGVRVEAVNLLVRSLERDINDIPNLSPEPEEGPLPTGPSVERAIRALDELQRRDPSRYVRLRSAAALREIGPRELQ